MSHVTDGVSIREEVVPKSNKASVTGALQWGAVLVAVISAACHMLSLATGPTPSSLQVVVLLAMGMGCLPCAMHLALLPRRRAWVQLAVVSVVMLMGHPLLSEGGPGPHGIAHEGGAAGDVGAAMVLLPMLGLLLALSGLALRGTRPASTAAAT